MSDQLTNVLEELADHWLELAEFYRALADDYADEIDIGHAEGAADAFESAGKIVQSITVDELDAITRHFADVARIYEGETELEKDAITRVVSDYGRVYGRGKSNSYVEVLRELSALNARYGTENRAHYPRYVCEWERQPEADFRNVKETVSVLDAEMALYGAHVTDQWLPDSKAYRTILRFVLRVPSAAVLHDFIDRAGREIGLTQWRPITERDVYYACDWVVDDSMGLQHAARDVFEIAFALNCALYVTSEVDDRGYKIRRFILRAPSESAVEVFKNTIPHSLKLENWQPVTQDKFLGVMNPFGTEIYRFWLDGLRHSAAENQQLRDKLARYMPVYMACDWVVPPLLSPRWVRETLLPAYRSCSRLGADLRYTNADTDLAAGKQRFLVRLLPEDDRDLLTFKDIMLQKTALTGWFTVTEAVFLQGRSITANTWRSGRAERDLSFNLYKLGKANAKV